MSAFFLALNRDGSKFDTDLANMMLAQLDCFGIDGSSILVDDDYAMGHQRHWLVPEEVGEHQPLHDADSQRYLLFQGRIDNREELYELVDGVEIDHLSDAQLLMLILADFDSSYLSKIKGPFVFALFDPVSKKILAARDGMGGRHLNYYLSNKLLILTTYEMAAVAHPAVEYELNHRKLIRWLSYQSEPQPESFVSDLQVLLPGESLTVTKRTTSLSLFYTVDPNHRISFASKDEYAVHFRSLLDQAVRRRLRSHKTIGCMLSGGMDSVPIAISAATHLAEEGRSLTSFSWVFDEHAECDERRFSEKVCEDFSIHANWINCDSVWPRFDDTTHVDPAIPLGTEYSEYNQVLLAEAQRQKVGIMLSGIGGDLLYSGTAAILIELLFSGQLKAFRQEFTYLWAKSSKKPAFWRNLILAPLVKKVLGRYWRSKTEYPEYLVEKVKTSKREERSWLFSLSAKSLRPQQYRNLLDGFEGDDAHFGRRMEAKYKLEKRYPLRDRDLVEFMLAIPVTELYSCGVTRPIVKSAFAKEFRKELYNRQTKTDFTTVVSDGVVKDPKYSEWLFHKGRDWPKFVKESYILDSLDTDAPANRLRWQLAYYEFWKIVCYNFFLKNLGDTDGRVDEKL